MKRVVKTDQVCHLWAHQSQSNARTGNGNVSFEGVDLYSYSTVIGHIDLEKRVVFCSNYTHSVTTTCHQSEMRYALRGNDYIIFSSPWSRQSRYFSSARECIEEGIKALQLQFVVIGRKKKNVNYSIERYKEYLEEIKTVAGIYNYPMPDLPAIDDDILQRAKDTAAIENAARREENKRQLAVKKERMEADKAQFENWLDASGAYFPSSYHNHNTDYITIRGDGNVITSRGAECPLSHVKKALVFYDSRRQAIDQSSEPKEVGMYFIPWQKNGHTVHLGAFQLDSIDSAGNVKAGCHNFSAEEIARFRAEWEL